MTTLAATPNDMGFFRTTAIVLLATTLLADAMTLNLTMFLKAREQSTPIVVAIGAPDHVA
jgi:hypothetical protein